MPEIRDLYTVYKKKTFDYKASTKTSKETACQYFSQLFPFFEPHLFSIFEHALVKQVPTSYLHFAFYYPLSLKRAGNLYRLISASFSATKHDAAGKTAPFM